MVPLKIPSSDPEFPGAEHLRPPRLGPTSAELSPRLGEILDELEAIFVAEGFDHLPIGALASRLRCSRRTLYELAERAVTSSCSPSSTGASAGSAVSCSSTCAT
jgi:hypothetical protein